MRRGRKDKALPFEQAFGLINKLEHAVIEHMVTAEFTVDEALNAMYGEDVVNKLRAAWPLVRDSDRGYTSATDLEFFPQDLPEKKIRVYIAARDAKILIPELALVRHNAMYENPGIQSAVEAAHTEHLQFEKVRQVVRWFNNNATPGAARHYCPWLTSVLPQDHPFQQASGLTYREPVVSMSEIVPVMRQCAEIMARALLCGDVEHVSDKNNFKVAFHGQRDGENYTSQSFGLI